MWGSLFLFKKVKGHPKAKYHAYIDNKSVCGRYVQSNHYFRVSIEESELLANKKSGL